jgi:hypothetical protein
MAGVTDERDLQPSPGVTARLSVDLGDERADGVDDLEVPLLAAAVHLRRDAVRGEDDERALGHVVLRFDEDRAARLEVANDMDVVHDLMTNVHRRPVLLQQLLDDVDRPDDARAKAPGRGNEDPLPHESASAARCRALIALRASRVVLMDSRGSVTKAFATTFQSVPPSALPAETSAPTERVPVSETARTAPARRPVSARRPLSMSTATAPELSARARRASGSLTTPSGDQQMTAG